MKYKQQLNYLPILIVLFIITSLLLAACGGGQETYTIGVVNQLPWLEPTFEGFKAGMADLGHVEGENITYIYSGVIENDPEVLDRETERLLAQDIDLLFAIGTHTAAAAKQTLEGTDIPLIFAPALNPVEAGIVQSIRQPGGNVTGVKGRDFVPKALEWLLKIGPETTKVYVPYHSKDEVSVRAVASLSEAAPILGVELVLDEASTRQEVVAAIETLSPEIGAMFLVPSPSLGTHSKEFIEIAVEQGIAVGSGTNAHLEQGALVIVLV